MTDYQQRLALSVREAADLSGLGRTRIYAAISSRELPSIKFGKRRLIRRAALDEWLKGMESKEKVFRNEGVA